MKNSQCIGTSRGIGGYDNSEVLESNAAGVVGDRSYGSLRVKSSGVKHMQYLRIGGRASGLRARSQANCKAGLDDRLRILLETWYGE